MIDMSYMKSIYYELIEGIVSCKNEMGLRLYKGSRQLDKYFKQIVNNNQGKQLDDYELAFEVLSANQNRTKFWKQLNYILKHNRKYYDSMENNTKEYLKERAHKIKETKYETI